MKAQSPFGVDGEEGGAQVCSRITIGIKITPPVADPHNGDIFPPLPAHPPTAQTKHTVQQL